ncbi:hypothetical protein GQ457_10G026210 [Hibiscus cannabinus]
MPDTEFLVLASDGLWEEVSGEEAVDTKEPVTPKVTVKKTMRITGNTQGNSKENNEDYGCVKASPSSKTQRISS